MFTRSHTLSDKLPPTEDSLKQHIMLANYQSHVWYNTDKPILNLPSPNENGWTVNDEEELIPLMMTKPLAPAALLDLQNVAVKEIVEATDANAKRSTYAVQILANVVLNNVPIIILMNKVTLVVKIMIKA